MRTEAGKYRFGDYSFVLELDTGGDPDYPYTVWVNKGGKPFAYNDSDRQVRRDFPKKLNRRHVENFCKKFALDDEYRSKYTKDMGEF